MIQYLENRLTAEILNTLRESVDWRRFCDHQAKIAIQNTLFSVVALEADRPVAMGRAVGDGAAYLSLVDVAVAPGHQGMGLGSEVVRRILDGLVGVMEREGLERVAVNIVSAPGREDFYHRLGFSAPHQEGGGTGMQRILTRTGGED